MSTIDFAAYLKDDWKPALGCTEPASIAYAAASAAHQAGGDVEAIRLVCDPRIYKNCYAVGIPNSGHKVGIRWALAIGALLPDPSSKLECFKDATADIVERAGRLIDSGAVCVEVDVKKQNIFVDCQVTTSLGHGRAVIQDDHTGLVRLERDGAVVFEKAAKMADRTDNPRFALSRMSYARLMELSEGIGAQERALLRKGIEYNLAIAEHGLSLFPKNFIDMAQDDAISRIGRRVCAGVYARMSGEDFVVMSLAGSGNKGITTSVPLVLWAQEQGIDDTAVEEALALSCAVTSSITEHLGTLSAVCGCSNAAGIGLTAGLVYLDGGPPDQISLAVRNMVGNVTGMICDGAKIGCALKTLTSVDAAFRSASLAKAGIGIPATDGIIGEDDSATLAHLGRIATRGMTAMDSEILAIMQEKLAARPAS